MDPRPQIVDDALTHSNVSSDNMLPLPLLAPGPLRILAL